MNQFGFNTYTSSETLVHEQQVGATVMRMIVAWPTVEPSPEQWNWSVSDQQYQSILAAGLRPEIVAFASPCWARPSMTCDDSAYTGPPDAGHDGDWTDFVQKLTARYPAAIGIEIWNEPNLVSMWWPKVDPVRYTQILKEAYGAVKAIAPSMPVVSGGLLGSPLTGWTAAGEGDAPFLAAIYASGGAPYMDAIGVHPYPVQYDSNWNPIAWNPVVMEQTLGRLRSVRDAGAATGTASTAMATMRRAVSRQQAASARSVRSGLKAGPRRRTSRHGKFNFRVRSSSRALRHPLRRRPKATRGVSRSTRRHTGKFGGHGHPVRRVAPTRRTVATPLSSVTNPLPSLATPSMQPAAASQPTASGQPSTSASLSAVITATTTLPPKPFWITEVGESTATQAGFPPAVSAVQQGLDIVTMFRAADSDSDVPVMIVHSLEDQLAGYADSFNGVQQGFGVFTSSWAPKPAACALSALLHGPLVCS
ncbi:MAG: hypothetical protein ACYC91_01385 [Solirubrobacteraceae bacterium]